MNYQKIKGVIVPLLTPLDAAGNLNLDLVAPHVAHLIAAGVKGIFPLGTTGEGPLFSVAERMQLAEAVIQAVDHRLPVIIHTGSLTTQESMRLSQHAHQSGADAVAMLPPFYYHYDDSSLFRHFAAVATAVPDLPIYLYNFPLRTGNILSLDLVQRLTADYPNIIGLKDSSGSLDLLEGCRQCNLGRFNTAIGSDRLIQAGIGNGIDASVSGNANLVPELVVQLYDAALKGDARAAELQVTLNRVADLVDGGADLALYKGLLARRGLPFGGVRAPLPPTTQARIDACWSELQGLDLDLSAMA